MVLMWGIQDAAIATVTIILNITITEELADALEVLLYNFKKAII